MVVKPVFNFGLARSCLPFLKRFLWRQFLSYLWYKECLLSTVVIKLERLPLFVLEAAFRYSLLLYHYRELFSRMNPGSQQLQYSQSICDSLLQLFVTICYSLLQFVVPLPRIIYPNESSEAAAASIFPINLWLCRRRGRPGADTSFGLFKEFRNLDLHRNTSRQIQMPSKTQIHRKIRIKLYQLNVQFTANIKELWMFSHTALHWPGSWT